MQDLPLVWIFHKLVFKKQVAFKPQAHQLQAEEIHMQDDSIWSKSEEFTYSNNSFCLQMQIQHVQAKLKLSTTSDLITNLAYMFQPHYKWNQYLRAHLDTCADVNIMTTSVYKPVFSDPDLRKLGPSKLEIGTYTTDTVKLVGSCTFYLVHTDTKWP